MVYKISRLNNDLSSWVDRHERLNFLQTRRIFRAPSPRSRAELSAENVSAISKTHRPMHIKQTRSVISRTRFIWLMANSLFHCFSSVMFLSWLSMPMLAFLDDKFLGYLQNWVGTHLNAHYFFAKGNLQPYFRYFVNRDFFSVVHLSLFYSSI